MSLTFAPKIRYLIVPKGIEIMIRFISEAPDL